MHTTKLADELMRLRKGWGLQADLSEKLGPVLRRLAGIGDSDAQELQRTRLIAVLTEAAGDLPQEMGLFALVGLCAWPEARLRTLDERLAWLAERADVSQRTALRRLDEAQRRLAQALSSRSVPPDEDWYVESLSSVMRVTDEYTEAIERRVIVCRTSGLTELDTSISVPRHPTDEQSKHGLEIELVHGGHLELREQPYEGYFRNVIALSKPLSADERHEFTLRFRTPPGQPMAPHYVHIPMRRSDAFDIRIGFDSDRMPKHLWILDAAPSVAVYQRTPGTACVTPDKYGEIGRSFRLLRPGLAYGFCWQP